MRELLIGCGHFQQKRMSLKGEEAWGDLTTLDINPDVRPDVVHDLNALPLPFSDQTFDRIYGFEVLEHCGRQGDWRFFFDQWSDFHRIIKPDGFFIGTCPHYTSPWAWGDPSHTRIIGAECLTFLDQSQYEGQEGRSPMTDFRPHYKADWRIVYSRVNEMQIFEFVMQAKKASVVGDSSVCQAAA